MLVNIHSLDLARRYCGRLVGLAAGRLVFDGPPAALTEDAARRLYGLEAAEAVGPCPRTAAPRHRLNPQGDLRRMFSRRTLLGAATTLAAAPTVLRAQSWKSAYPELVFAIIPSENASGVINRYTPFTESLSKALGTKVTLRVASDYAAVIEGQRAGNIHIASYGPSSFARALMTGAPIEAFAIEVNQRRHQGLLLGLLCPQGQPVPDGSRT